LALGLVALIYFNRAALLDPYLKNQLAILVEKTSGTRIHIGYLGGDYFTYLELRNLRTLQPGNRLLTLVSAKRLRLRYKAAALLHGLDAFLTTLRVECEDARIELRLVPATGNPSPPPIASRGQPLYFPSQLPHVILRGMTVRLAGPDYTLMADQVSLLTPSPNHWRLQARTVQLRHPLIGEKSFALDLRVGYQDQRLVMAGLDLGTGLAVDKVVLDLKDLRSGKMAYQVGVRLFRGRLNLEGGMKPGGQQVRLHLEKIDLKEATSFFHLGWKSPGQLDLDAQAGFNPDHWGSLQGTAVLGIRQAEVAGVTINVLALEAKAGDGKIEISTLRVRNGRNTLQASHLETLTEDLFADTDQAWQKASGRFQARIVEIPPSLRSSLKSLNTQNHSFWIDGRLQNGRLIISRGALELQTRLKGPYLTKASGVASGFWLELVGAASPLNENSVSIKNFSVPLGDLVHGRFGPVVRSLQAGFSLRFKDLPALLAMVGVTPEQSRALHATTFDLEGRMEKGRVFFRLGKLIARGIQVLIQHATLVLPEKGGLQAARIDAEIQIMAPDLQKLGALSGVKNIEGSLNALLFLNGELSNPVGKALVHMDNTVVSLQGSEVAWSKLNARVESRQPVKALNFTGNLDLQKGELRLGPAMPSIKDLSARIQLQGRKILVQAVQGAVGGSYFTLSGDLMKQEQVWPYCRLQLQGKNLLFYRDVGVKVRANTDLTVTGPWNRLLIAGDIKLTDSRFVENFDFMDFLRGGGKPQAENGFQLFSIPDPPLKDAQFKIHISASDPFLIKNNLANGSVRPELLLTGTGEVPQLIGTVYFDPTRISLPSGTLQIQSGYLRFLESNPDEPQLTVNGQTDLQGYQITLAVAGALSNPTITVTSNPPLPEEDAILLVLTGTPPKSQTGTSVQTGTAVNVALFLGRGYLTKLFGSSSAEAGETVLDRFQLDIGQNYSQIPVDPANNNTQTFLASYLLAHNLLLKKDDFYLTSEKDIYGDYNLGVKEVLRFK
jgi:hypothetical protein